MFNRKAQSTAEYAIVIALVVGAVVAMQVYVRRGLQGRMKGAVDTYLIGGTSGAGQIPKKTGDGLYEPYYLKREITQTRKSPTYEVISDATGEEGQVQRGIGSTDPLGSITTGEKEETTVEKGSFEQFGTHKGHE